MRKFRRIAVSLAVLFVTTFRVLFATTPATQPLPELPSLIVSKRLPATQPRIDASCDDPAWKDAAVIPSLELCIGASSEGMQPTPTTVRVLWDDQNLYVRFFAQDDDLYAPHGSEKNVSHSDGDVVEIFLDPVGDGRQFFEIQCNPAGGWMDAVHAITTQPTSGEDGLLTAKVIGRDSWFFLGWDMPGLRIAAAAFRKDDQHGWIADFALPAKPILRRLGLSKYQPMSLRINFVRYDAADPNPEKPPKTVEMAWSPVAWGRPHRSPARMGNLVLKE